MAADQGMAGLAHHGSEDFADALEQAVSTLHEDDLLLVGTGQELTIDHIHNLSTAPQPMRIASYHSVESSELASSGLYSSGSALAAGPTHIGDIIPKQRPSSSNSSVGGDAAEVPRRASNLDNEADSGVSPLPKVPGRRTPRYNKQPSMSGPSSHSGSRPTSAGDVGASSGSAGRGSKGKLPRVALLAKLPPKKEEPASPSRSRHPASARSPASGRASTSTGPSPTKASSTVQCSNASDGRVAPRASSASGSRIPLPGGLGSPAPKEPQEPATTTSPPQKVPPSPQCSAGANSPQKSAPSPQRSVGTMGASRPKAPVTGGASSRGLYTSGSTSTIPTARGSGYGQRAVSKQQAGSRVGERRAGAVGAAAAADPSSPSKVDTRRQLEDIMRDLQDIKKDLGLPVGSPGAADGAVEGTAAATAKAQAEAQAVATATAAAADTMVAATEEGSSGAAQAASAKLEAEAAAKDGVVGSEEAAAAGKETATDAAAGSGGGGCGSGAEGGAAEAGSSPKAAAAAAILGAAGADDDVVAAPEEKSKHEEAAEEAPGVVSTMPEAGDAEALPTSTAAAYIDASGTDKPKPLETELAGSEAAAKQCCACVIM